MMDFLENLFNYEYFGPILFAVIAILIVLFFIILFFGKKDEKERILEETRKLELANLNAFKEQEEEPTKIEIPKEELKSFDEINENEKQFEEVQSPIEIEEKKLEETVELDTPVLTPTTEIPLVINSDEKTKEDNMINDIPSVPEFKIEPSIPTDIPKYDFEELAKSISKELDEIERINILNKEEIKEEAKEDDILPEIKIQESQVEVTPIKEIKKFKPSPVFSSVFVNQKENIVGEDMPKSQAVEEEKKEELQQIETPASQEISKDFENNEKGIDFSVLKSNLNQNIVKPKIDLPKTIELPKKANENKIETNVPNFDDIQGESYNLHR